MEKQKITITTLKLVYALLFLICLSVSSTDCFANVPIKLQITGTETFESFSCPDGGYTASLTGATSTGEYEWDISTATPYGEVVNSQGRYATISFTSAPSASEGEVTVKILCKTYYMDGNQRKSESAHLNVTWRCPRLTYGINGNTEVLDGIEETYTAWVAIENQNPTIKYFWKKGESQGNGIEADLFTTTFNSEDGQNVTLYCDIKAGDIPLTAEKEIHVHSYAMTVTRWDYSGTLVNGKVKHTHSTTFDNVLMYIHYNVDNDDTKSKKDKEYDFEKLFFKGGVDDDLCELVIDINVNGDFDISDLNKSLTINKTSNLRLWKSQERKKGHLIMGDIDSVSWTSGQLNDIIGKTIYVEGIERDAKGCIEILFGNITKKLRYATCSVGDKDDQPKKKERKRIKKEFENLVDCEWYVLREENNAQYNCIAFSVDPYQNKFANVDYEGGPQLRNKMKIDPKYPNPFWVNKIGKERKPCPVNEADREDKFWLSLTAKINLWQALTFPYYLETVTATLHFAYAYTFIPPRLYLLGYDAIFKNNVLSVLERLGITDFDAQYILNMNDFNPNGLSNYFDEDNDVNAFFRSPVWKNAGNSMTSCDLYDPNRIVTYYSGFHAARRASTLLGNEKVEETNMPPGWYIFASKCGDWVTLIHREEQIGGITYGQKIKTYKY